MNTSQLAHKHSRVSAMWTRWPGTDVISTMAAMSDVAEAGVVSRRTLMRLPVVAGLTVAGMSGTAQAALGPILKPLPPEWFDVHGTNAETRWEALSGQGYHVPADRFFVRNHTSTPLIDVHTWRLRLFGSALDRPTEFTYQDLRSFPAEEISAFIECAGNGRSFFASQQGQQVSGTPWQLGAIGVARWRGVRLSTVLNRAGLRRDAVDVLPEGLDADYVAGGVNLGKVRRPLPIAKAMDDVLLAYEMNDQPLLPDHGFPVRLVVPSWVGIASIKWLGRIEVANTPLVSPWSTQFYRLLGPAYPAEGTLVSRQVVKSAFELPRGAVVPAGRVQVLRGRSWSGNGRIRRVDVSTDGGATWCPARLVSPALDRGWAQWVYPWRPEPGSYTLRARATDVTGASQPVLAEFNTQGYLFDGIVEHPVTVTRG